MTTFDDRDKGFETKFAKDKELSFKVNARRNKTHGDDSSDVVKKLMDDFKAAGVELSSADIRAEMARLQPIAEQQIRGDML
jgi:hypothetical protein